MVTICDVGIYGDNFIHAIESFGTDKAADCHGSNFPEN
jgi:hypothetical protein